jgi:hypothetical protein
VDKKTKGLEKLDDSELLKVAGGFEIGSPLLESIRPNLVGEERNEEHSEDYSEETFPTGRLD